MFQSTSRGPLGYHDRGHTFSQLRVLPDGSCLAAERAGFRDIGKSKGLVVRYENPFVRRSEPTVLYESKAPLLALAPSSNGIVYAVCSKQLHTNETGKWKATTPKIEGATPRFLSAVFVHQSTPWLGDYNHLYQRTDAGWRSALSIDGPARWHGVSVGSDLYLTKRETAGVLRSGSETIAPLPGVGALTDAVVVPAGNGVAIVDGARLFVGDVARGFTAESITAPTADHLVIDAYVEALGGGYVATSTHLYRRSGSTLVPVMQATGWIAKACAGNSDVLWIANGTELLCTDGKDWTIVPRALDARTRS